MWKNPSTLGFAKSVGLSNAKGTILGKCREMFVVTVPETDPAMGLRLVLYGNEESREMRSYKETTIRQAMRRRESIIVSDAYGYLHERLATTLRANGYKVSIYDHNNPDKKSLVDILDQASEISNHKSIWFILNTPRKQPGKQQTINIENISKPRRLTGTAKNRWCFFIGRIFRIANGTNANRPEDSYRRRNIPITVILRVTDVINVPKTDIDGALTQAIGIKLHLLAPNILPDETEYPIKEKALLDSCDIHVAQMECVSKPTKDYLTKLFGSKKLPETGTIARAVNTKGDWKCCKMEKFQSPFYEQYIEI